MVLIIRKLTLVTLVLVTITIVGEVFSPLTRRHLKLLLIALIFCKLVVGSAVLQSRPLKLVFLRNLIINLRVKLLPIRTIIVGTLSCWRFVVVLVLLHFTLQKTERILGCLYIIGVLILLLILRLLSVALVGKILIGVLIIVILRLFLVGIVLVLTGNVGRLLGIGVALVRRGTVISHALKLKIVNKYPSPRQVLLFWLNCPFSPQMASLKACSLFINSFVGYTFY